MFSFVPLVNNSVTTRLGFLLQSMSAIISSKTIFYVFYLGCIQCFYTYHPYHLSIQ